MRNITPNSLCMYLLYKGHLPDMSDKNITTLHTTEKANKTKGEVIERNKIIIENDSRKHSNLIT